MGLMTGLRDTTIGMLGKNFTEGNWLGKAGSIGAGLIGAGVAVGGAARISDAFTGKRGDDGRSHPIGNMLSGAAMLGVGAGGLIGASMLAGKFAPSAIRAAINSGIGTAGSAMGLTAGVGGAVLSGRLITDGITGRKRDDGSRAGWGSVAIGAGMLAGAGIGMRMGIRGGMLNNLDPGRPSMSGHIIRANNAVNSKAQNIASWWGSSAAPKIKNWAI